MGLYKRFTAFLILLLLVSTFVAVSHHHENTADNHDCPICLVSPHQHATSQTTVAFDGVPFIVESIFVVSAPISAEKIFIACLNNRAPPA